MLEEIFGCRHLHFKRGPPLRYGSAYLNVLPKYNLGAVSSSCILILKNWGFLFEYVIRLQEVGIHLLYSFAYTHPLQSCGTQAVCSCVPACEMAPFQPVLSLLRALWLPSPCPVYLIPLYFQSLTDLQAVLSVPTCTQLKIFCTGSASLSAKGLLPYFVKWILSRSSSSLKTDPGLWKPKHSLQHWLQSSLLVLNVHPHLSRLFPSMRSSPRLSCSLPLLSKRCNHSCSVFSR